MDTALQNTFPAAKAEMREQIPPGIKSEFIRDKLTSEEFLTFMEKNQAPYKEAISYYRCAIMEVETKFKVLNEQFSLRYDDNPIEFVKSRIKSTDSLLRKIRKKNIPLDINAITEQITDIAGVRVICSFPEDIYRLADSFTGQDDVTLLERKDYIQDPKPSGYRSLHLIIEIPIFLENEKRNVKVEVQFRTIAMDFWASLEHKLRYKKSLSPEIQEKLAAELHSCAETISSLDRGMQQIRNDLRAQERPQ